VDFDLPSIYAEIDKQAQQFGVDPSTAKALLTAENTGSGSTTSRSTYSGAAVSPAGASGLFQVMPKTAEGLRQAGLLPADWKHDPTNLGSQVSAGLAAIKDMTSRLRDPNDTLELAAYYNGGSAGLRNYRDGTLTNPETTKYLQKVQRAKMELGTPLTPQQIERQAAAVPAGTTPDSSGMRQSASTSFSRNVLDPGALDAVINSLGVLNQPGGMYSQAYDAISDRGGQMAWAAADLQGAIGAVGAAAGAKASANAQEEATQTVVRQGILAASNLDPRATDNAMNQAMQRMDTTAVAMDKMRPEIDSMLAIDPLSDPLQWLIAQVQLPSKVAQYNNIQREQQDAIGMYDARSSIASRQISLGTALDADKILAKGAADADLATKEAVAKQKQVQFQMASKTAADALNNVQIAQQQLQGNIALAQLTKQRETERSAAAEAAKNKKLDEQTLTDLNQLIVAAGGTSLNWERLKQLPAKSREELLTAAVSKKFGSTLGEATQFIDSVGSIPGMANGGQLGVVNWLQKSLQQANTDADAEKNKAIAMGQTKSFDPLKARFNAMNNLGNKYQTEADSDMRRASAGNPFKLDYTNTVKNPALQGNKWAENIIKFGPTGDNTLPKLDEQAMFQRAITDITMAGNPGQSAQMVKQYAQDIANFYKAATAQQAQDTKYAMFGMYRPQKTYGVNLPDYMVKATDILDLGNAAQVEKFLTRQTANGFMRQMQNRSSFTGLYN